MLEQEFVDADLRWPRIQTRSAFELQLLVQHAMYEPRRAPYVSRTDFKSMKCSHAQSTRRAGAPLRDARIFP